MIKYPIWLLLLYLSADAQVSLIPFNKGGKFGYLGLDGTSRLPAAYESADIFLGGVGVVSINGKYGVIDERGNWIVKPSYDAIYVNSIDSILTVRRGNANGFLRLNGQPLTPVKYYSVDGFNWGVARVFQVTSHPQAVNKKGKELIPVTHFFEGQTHHGFMKVIDRKTEKAGVIDSTGKFFLPCNYDDLIIESEYNGNFIVVKRYVSDAGIEMQRYGVAGAGGKEGIPVRFRDIRSLRNGLYAVKVEERWGVMTGDGEVLLNDDYQDIRPAQGDYFFYAIRTADGIAYGIMNKKLEVILQPVCLDIKNMYKNCFQCRKNTGWGLMNLQGKTIIPFEYWESYETIGGNPNNYHDLYVWAEKGNTCFLYERDGRYLASFAGVRYLHIHDNGLISFDDRNLKQRMLFNKYGKQLLPPEYLSYINFDKLVFLKKVSDQKWYAVNEAGEIINLPYDEIDEFSRVGSFIRVRRGEQYFYMDSSGKEYIEK